MKQKLMDYQTWRAKAIKDPAVRRALREADDDPAVNIALQLIRLRRERGWTQAELAGRLRTSQQAIARLESLDYAGYSLALLGRIAEAFDKRLKVQFV